MENNSDSCEWEQEDEDDGVFNTDCKETFMVPYDPQELGDWANFCIYCGKPLKVKLWEYLSD